MKQVNDGTCRSDVFAGTPPLRAARIIVPMAASKHPKRRRVVGLHDARVVFFHAVMDEEVYVRPPPGLRRPGKLWRLLRALYGTRKAAQLWQTHYSKVFTDGGFTVVKCVPGTFYSEALNLEVVAHCDDFLSASTDESQDAFDRLLQEL